MGLCFKVAHGLIKFLREQHFPQAISASLRHLLAYAALGTVADLVPLRGENRVLASLGLQRLPDSPYPGIQALLEIADLSQQKPLTSRHVAFQLAPRLNAAGRMATATDALQLFLCDDTARAKKIAMQLDSYNQERKTLENIIYQQALSQATSLEDPALVLSSQTWHTGVLGIVAGRIARDCRKPCIALHLKDGLLEGSGRSISAIDLQEAILPSAHLLERWGGHTMAVGLSLLPENLSAFKKAFLENISHQLQAVPPATLHINTWISSEDLNSQLIDTLATLEPFGQQAPAPVFALAHTTLSQRPKPMGIKHCRFLIPTPPRHDFCRYLEFGRHLSSDPYAYRLSP